MLRFAPLLLPIALANCGSILASIELANRVDEAERLESLIATTDESDLNSLSDDEMQRRQSDALAQREAGNPDAGIVRYNGQGAMEVPLGNETVILSSIARIDADFADSTVTATFSDWLGYNDGDTLGDNANGNITFSNGVIGDEESASNIAGDVAGSLTFKGDTYTLDGVIDGTIATIPGDEGLGGATVDEETVITRNGVVIEGAQFGFAGTR